MSPDFKNKLSRWLTALFTILIACLPFIAVLIEFLNKRIALAPYIPAVVGVPAAAIGAFLVIYLIASQRSHDYEPRTPWNERLNPYWLVLLWLGCFLAIIFSIWLLWPKQVIQHSETGIDITKTDTTNGNIDNMDNIDITLLQINDVYEISALDNGKSGGLARVATFLKQLKKEHSNVYTLLAGDFLFPSALGTIRDGPKKKQIKGLQMIDVLNALPVDLVTFGNHEFDVDSLEDLEERINRSNFEWVSSNVLKKPGKTPFSKTKNAVNTSIPPIKIVPFRNKKGDSVRLGILGLTIPSTQKYYVQYSENQKAIKAAIKKLKEEKADIIIALTHLNRSEDTSLARLFPEIRLFIGGHEHVNSFDEIGNSYVAKADANVRTVYVHSLSYNPRTHDLSIRSKLETINYKIKNDTAVENIITRWNHWADSAWTNTKGFGPPCEILAELNPDQPLDGAETSVRFRPTNLTDMIAKAMYVACTPETIDASLYNSGSIRLDDSIRGTVTRYDVIRTIPYSGKIFIVEMKGFLLEKLLKISISKRGNGCFLQYYKIDDWGNSWMINGNRLRSDKTYRIAINDFLLTGKQEFMEFLKKGCAGLEKIYDDVSVNPSRESLVTAVSEFIKENYTRPIHPQKSNVKVPCY